MNMAEAEKIMQTTKPGYRVSFEHVEDGGHLRSDYFPARDELLIPTIKQAWELAHRFAAATYAICVEIQVVDVNVQPVEDGSQTKKIRPRPITLPLRRPKLALQSTKDYSLFEVHSYNYDAVRTKLLEQSMREHGFDPGLPMRCVRTESDKLLITHGSHRFHVAYKLGIEVWYIVSLGEVAV